MNLNVKIKKIPNPRKEKEEHYYNPVHSGLNSLGLKANLLNDDVLAGIIEQVLAALG